MANLYSIRVALWLHKYFKSYSLVSKDSDEGGSTVFTFEVQSHCCATKKVNKSYMYVTTY